LGVPTADIRYARIIILASGEAFRQYFSRIDVNGPICEAFGQFEEFAGKGEEEMMDLLHRTFSRRTAAKSLLSAGAAGVVGVSLAKAAAQPHMEAALKALQNAATQLQSAEEDKGGHRAKAIPLVNQAISQVQQGIQAGAGK
jgi:hypothetical protein